MARKGKKHRSASQKQQFLAYQAENRQEKNKMIRLERHIRGHSEDLSAQKQHERIKSVGQTYRRTTNSHSNFEPKRTQLEAQLVRANTTGAITTDASGKVIAKALPQIRRGKFISNMTIAFNEAGIKNGRFYRALQA